MFETLSLYSLQQYWWILTSILASTLVFLLFVQGGQTLIYRLGKTREEQSLIVNSLGRKWEFTFTTLVVFGGAFFASFPLFYATSFGGAYWVWITILFCFVLQAVSYEFRSKPSNFLGRRIFDTFLFINGLVSTLLIGTAVGTFFTGSEFSLSELNQVTWHGKLRGIEAAFNLQNLSLGLSLFFLARTLACLYFKNNIDSPFVTKRIKKELTINFIPFLIFFLFFLIKTIVSTGFALNSETGIISMEDYKYLHNLADMPANTIIMITGIIAVLFGVLKTIIKPDFTSGIWISGAGTILTVFSLFILAGFNDTAFYPSVYDLQSSLTIRKASSSHYTLTAMSYISLLIPIVIAYIWHSWRAINKDNISIDEREKEGHKY